MRAALATALLLTLGGPLAAQGFTVTGAFAYADKEWDFDGWTGARPERPIRGADVIVCDAATGKVLGRGVTAPDGSYEIVAKPRHPLEDIVVRVESRNRERRALIGPFTGISVVSGTGDVYAASSEVFAAHDTTLPLDTGTSVAGTVTIAGEEGNPFDIFDCTVAAFEYVTGPVLGAKPHGSVTLHWPSYSGSWALGRQAWISSDDGYDDSVILHEIGHLVHNLYSDSDSPGGVHYFGDSDQDPRLSFAEGFATFFSGCVQQSLGRPAFYVDCDATADMFGAQLRLRIEDSAPYIGSVEGASDEIAVACVLNDLVDDVQTPDAMAGDDDALAGAAPVDGLTAARAWWAVFTGPMRKSSRLTMDHAWDGWLALHAEDPHYEQLRAVFEGQRMRFWNDAAEPDNAPELATLIEPSSAVAWLPERTLYFTPDDGDGDGTGDRDWFAVDLQAGQVVRIETRYPAGAWDARTQADTFLTLCRPDGKAVASDDDSGAGRNARLEGMPIGESGRWLVEVRSRNKVHRYGRYELHVVVLSGP